jgi:hypothetical protein
MMSPRPAIETADFIALDDGGTRIEHRIRVENRAGISFLWYRVSMALLKRAGGTALSTLTIIMDEDAAAVEQATAAEATPQQTKDGTA